MSDPRDRVFVTDEPLVAGEAEGTDLAHGEAVELAHGAAVTFRGVVRDHNDGRAVEGIFYECYQEMARQEMARIVTEIESDFPARVVRAVHRVGEMRPGETSLVVVVTSAHRGEAFAAVQAFVDRLKERVPIWKKERYADESSAWL